LWNCVDCPMQTVDCRHDEIELVDGHHRVRERPTRL
jgi:hypothetical protein